MDHHGEAGELTSFEIVFRDPAQVHRTVAAQLLASRMVLCRDPAQLGEFELRICDGNGHFSIARLRHTATLDALVSGVEDIVVGQVLAGRITIRGARSELEVGPGQVFLLPDDEPFAMAWSAPECQFVRLDRDALTRFTSDLAGSDLAGCREEEPRIGLLTPISGSAAHRWQQTVTRVRDEVLADPVLGDDITRLDAAFDELAVGFLAAFDDLRRPGHLTPVQPLISGGGYGRGPGRRRGDRRQRTDRCG